MPAPKDPQKYEEWRRKQSKAHKGQKPSEETRKKSSERMKKRREDPIYMEKLLSGIKNRPMTDEYREKLSNAAKNRVTSEETRKKIGNAKKGKKHSEETKRKMSEKQKGNRNGTYSSKESREKAAERIKLLHEKNRGQKLTEEHRQKLSTAFKGKANEKLRQASKLSWEKLSPEERLTRINKALDATSGKPSSLEKKVSEILQSLEINHSKQFRIGKYFADIYIQESNLILECLGCYWHCCEQCGFDNIAGRKEKDEKRTKYIKEKGYNIAFLWEHDLKKDALACVLSKLQ